MRSDHEITVEEIKNCPDLVQYYKYVRIGNEFFFTSMELCHTDLVNEGETPVSAGTLKYYKAEGLFTCDDSMTLKIGPAKDDDELLAKLFDMPIKEDRWF